MSELSYDSSQFEVPGNRTGEKIGRDPKNSLAVNDSVLRLEVLWLGGIPKWPKGADCKSAAVTLHRFESCSHHLFLNKYLREHHRSDRRQDESLRGSFASSQDKDYIFYYGPYKYKDCDTYVDFLEREWLKSFWDKGLPKHHRNMHYYLNAFPHGCGASRPVGPESDPYSYLGFTKWLIQELKDVD